MKAGKLPADVNDSSESQSQYQTRSAPGLEGEMLDVNGDPGSAQTQAQSGTRAKSPLEPPFKSRRLTETLMGGGDLLSMLGLRQLKEKKLNVDFGARFRSSAFLGESFANNFLRLCRVSAHAASSASVCAARAAAGVVETPKPT